MINRDRALKIMYELDAFWDEFGKKKQFSYYLIKAQGSDITEKEWNITNMYFFGKYRADQVIKKLELGYPFNSTLGI